MGCAYAAVAGLVKSFAYQVRLCVVGDWYSDCFDREVDRHQRRDVSNQERLARDEGGDLQPMVDVRADVTS
jgi:hypothetical protein